MGKFERKFGKYAIQRLSLCLILCYAFGYLIGLINSDFISYLTLNPFLIMKGQIWRIISWVLIPPESSNMFFVLIMLYFYYSIGTTLERTWGDYYYNIYIFSGILFTVIGSFAYFFYIDIQSGWEAMKNLDYIYESGGVKMVSQFTSVFTLFSTYYINMSIFLAFAATFPENQVLLMFIIPIKVKWLGIIYAIMLIFEVVNLGTVGFFIIGASLLNFIIFFVTTRKKMHRGPKQIHRQHVYQKQVKHASAITRHKCAVCGRTEQDAPNLEFRFCSKCEGNYEYCQDHLFTHQHIHR